MTKLMDLELTSTQMEPLMSETGLRTSSTGQEKKSGQTVLGMTDSTTMVKSMEKEL